MHQRWSDLLFIHWPVDCSALQKLLPEGLEVDTYNGQAYVGLVPFAMHDIHPTGLMPLPRVSSLLECNVRTYVTHGGEEPGVWFFSLDASSLPAVLVARLGWKLSYFLSTMKMKVSRSNSGGIGDDKSHDRRARYQYDCERLWPKTTEAACHVVWEPHGPVARAKPGSLEYFLVERYVLYAGNASKLVRARVHHAPYSFQSAEIVELKDTLVAAAGISVNGTAPPLAYFSKGVRVEVSPVSCVQRRETAAAPMTLSEGASPA